MPQPVSKRLIADDQAGLEVISAAVQDAVCKAADLNYAPSQKHFSIEINRFHWESAHGKGPYFRSRSIIGFDSVLGVRSRGLPLRGDKEAVLQVLSLSFDETDAPAGIVRLIFAGSGELELDVECVDVTLLDTDRFWPARKRPDHERKID